MSKIKESQVALTKKKASDAQKEKQRNYDESILIADAAFSNGDYETALDKYALAAKWLPSETYPAKRISEIKNVQRTNILKAEEEKK